MKAVLILFSLFTFIACNAQHNFPLLLPAQVKYSLEKPTALLSESDGSFIAAGIRNHNASLSGTLGVPGGMLIAKYNNLGTNIWTHFSPISNAIVNYVNVYGITKLNTGNYLVVGDSAVSGGVTLADAYILITEINNVGQRLWTKAHQILPNNFGYDMFLANCVDSNFIVVAYGFKKLKLDYTGNILKSITDNHFAFGITTLQQGNSAIIAGFTPSKLIKYDSELNINWTKVLNNVTPTSVVQGKMNKNIFISGYKSISNSQSLASALSLDSNGILIWQKNYSVDHKTQANNLIVDNNNLFITGETSTCLNVDTPNYCFSIPKIFVLKVDASTGVEIKKIELKDSIYATANNIDSGISLKGKFISFSDANNDHILISSHQALFRTIPFSIHGFFYTSHQEENIKIFKLGADLNNWPLKVFNQNQLFLAYPNPVQDYLYFDRTINNYKIFSMEGKLVKASANSNKIYTANLQQGIYILKGEINGQTTFHKFEKQ